MHTCIAVLGFAAQPTHCALSRCNSAQIQLREMQFPPLLAGVDEAGVREQRSRKEGAHIAHHFSAMTWCRTSPDGTALASE
ncbi:hypothetical protein GCM10007901_33500 [Dyella acidisoli]|uniref:Secreted protein n=1 Tax=Dyella acidisoli TaxID=1867834 RepID=A0ABQ5XS38_9GAMM|nr:hypothetical protein GCM10007901_33500 [Dyella acidisoli]